MEEDHTLLIRLDQKVSDLQNSVKEIKDGTISRIACLEADKAGKNEVEKLQEKINDDLEVRIRCLETRVAQIMTVGAVAVILLGVAQFLIGKFF